MQCNRNCPLLDEHDELDQTVCIAVAAEVLDSVTQLDTIKDVVILILLNTLVKGHHLHTILLPFS